MSINLHLGVGKKLSCDLVQTPTDVTADILRGTPSKYEVLHRYFKYIDQRWIVGAGALLDHKLQVALWMVKYPKCRWSGW